MTTTDASLSLTPTSKRKKSFYIEEEEIIIKPSSELIPDEYEYLTNESVLFHIFRTASDFEEHLATNLLQCVQSIDYKVDANNIHELNKLDELKSDLETIKKESVNKNALVLVFIGYFGKKDGTLLMLEEDETSQSVPIADIWNMFTSNNCKELKSKPKIFIFCTSKEPVAIVQTDSLRHRAIDFEKAYDFPTESDMLIVYEKETEVFARNKKMFINQFCSNIIDYSKKYDIIDLLSHIHDETHKPVPLIISTLTRKFYLTPSTEREHHLSLIENHFHLEATLQKIQEDVKKLHEAQKKKKEKKFSFSLRKKNDEKPKIVDRKKNPTKEQPKVSIQEPPISATVSRLSLGSGNVSVAGRRSRKQSETDGGQKKPIWRN